MIKRLKTAFMLSLLCISLSGCMDAASTDSMYNNDNTENISNTDTGNSETNGAVMHDDIVSEIMSSSDASTEISNETPDATLDDTSSATEIGDITDTSDTPDEVSASESEGVTYPTYYDLLESDDAEKINTISTGITLNTLDSYTVKRVVDGDTFVIEQNGKDVKVRLIGVDTPESVASQEYLNRTGKENTEEGKTASDYTKSLIEGRTVYLEFDVSTEDKYGRLLAYVYLEDGRMLQDILLSEGYAELMTIQPNVKYAEHFTETVKIARGE